MSEDQLLKSEIIVTRKADAESWLRRAIEQAGQSAVNWGRKWSLFGYPFVTACCGMEYMATACAHYDVDRFGAGLPRFSPRQADVLFVVGTISHKMAPVLKRIYDQLAEPRWVVSFGVCTCTGGFYDNYATVMGIDTIIPVDVYIPGCPPRPEAVMDGLMKLQARVQLERVPDDGRHRETSELDVPVTLKPVA